MAAGLGNVLRKALWELLRGYPLQEPFARSGAGAHGPVPEVLLWHDVAHFSSGDVNVII